jgi:hypothetical protein
MSLLTRIPQPSEAAARRRPVVVNVSSGLGSMSRATGTDGPTGTYVDAAGTVAW